MQNIASNDDENKARSPWFKCFPEDWLAATRGLTPEQRGIYFDCLCLIYQFEKPLPLDDKWMSHALHISTRLWRTIKSALVNAGKLVETPNGLINVRAQVELGSRSVQRRTKAESAVKRERTKREKSEKPNQNNEAIAHETHYAHARQIQIQNIDTEREELKPPPEQAAARGGSEEIPGLESLNGTAIELVKFIGRHANVLPHEAERMLRSNVQAMGSKAVLDAFVQTQAEMASGLVASPYKYLIGAARKFREGTAKPPEKPKVKPKIHWEPWMADALEYMRS